jgi:hypothetical protein
MKRYGTRYMRRQSSPASRPGNWKIIRVRPAHADIEEVKRRRTRVRRIHRTRAAGLPYGMALKVPRVVSTPDAV